MRSSKREYHPTAVFKLTKRGACKYWNMVKIMIFILRVLHMTIMKSFNGLRHYSSLLAHRLEDLSRSLNRQAEVAMRSITLASRHQKAHAV